MENGLLMHLIHDFAKMKQGEFVMKTLAL